MNGLVLIRMLDNMNRRMIHVDALVERKLCIACKGLLSKKIALRFLHYVLELMIK